MQMEIRQPVAVFQTLLNRIETAIAVILRTFSAEAELHEHCRKPFDHPCHAQVIELFGRVGRRVVMRITVERGVGNHERAVALAPERELIAP